MIELLYNKIRPLLRAGTNFCKGGEITIDHN